MLRGSDRFRSLPFLLIAWSARISPGRLKRHPFARGARRHDLRGSEEPGRPCCPGHVLRIPRQRQPSPLPTSGQRAVYGLAEVRYRLMETLTPLQEAMPAGQRRRGSGTERPSPCIRTCPSRRATSITHRLWRNWPTRECGSRRRMRRPRSGRAADEDQKLIASHSLANLLQSAKTGPGQSRSVVSP